MGEPGFWDHQETAKAIVAEAKVIKAAIEPVRGVLADLEDVRALYQLGAEAGDQDSLDEADRLLGALDLRAGRVELQALLDRKNDALNCFFTIQAGAGGTEAQDWSEMLLRMYTITLSGAAGTSPRSTASMASRPASKTSCCT